MAKNQETLTEIRTRLIKETSKIMGKVDGIVPVNDLMMKHFRTVKSSSSALKAIKDFLTDYGLYLDELNAEVEEMRVRFDKEK